MGIQGLTSYVNAHLVGKSFWREPIPAGSTLLLDFPSFVHHVYHDLPREQTLPQYLGDYSVIVSAFDEIFACFRHHNIKVVAYTDGARHSHHKRREMAKRRAQRSNERNNLEDFHFHRAYLVTQGPFPQVSDQEHEEPPVLPHDEGELTEERQAAEEPAEQQLPPPLALAEDVPIPPLLFSCAMWSLRQQLPESQVKKAAGEADAKMICDAAKLAEAGEEGVYIASTDSDFFAAKDCYFLPLDYLVVTLEEGISAVCFQRARLAASLGLTEQSLLCLAVLCGNDYTRAYGKERAAIVPRKNVHVQEVVAWLLAAQRNGPVELERRCKDNGFLAAVEYSFDLYNGVQVGFGSEEEEEIDVGVEQEGRESERVLLIPNVEFLPPVEAGQNVQRLKRFSKVAADVVAMNRQQFLARWNDVWLERMVESAMSLLTEKGFVSQEGLKRARLCCGIDAQEVPDSPNEPSDDNSQLAQSALCFQVVMKRLVERTQCCKMPACLYNPYAFFQLSKQESRSPSLPTTESQEMTKHIGHWRNGKAFKELPIEKYRDDILATLKHHRVVMVTGETGCGKSSFIPQLLHEECGGRARMFITQPRRLAATNLANRLKTRMDNLVGLRLGGGIREETPQTRIWLCTAGYLMTLILSRPKPFEVFKDHTHLVLDEVHERDIDMDLLLSFAKRLLKANKSIKVVLMSATLREEKLARYFKLPVGFVYVGAKCFPLKEVFLDCKHCKESVLPQHHQAVDSLVKTMNKGNSSRWLGKTEQIDIAVSLVRKLAQQVVANRNNQTKIGGGAVLIFVSGLDQMTQLCDRFETLYDKTRDPCYYRCVIVHSQVPLEEQQQAFTEIEDINTIKVVIATNAGESSITFPDVDSVICLGARKVLQYDTKNKSHVLSNRLISRASAVQRAGRAARTRPGTVYRLYTRKVYDELEEYDLPEVLTAPLTNLVLNLKSFVMNERGGVLPLFEELMDPPAQENVLTAMDTLRELDMLEGATDRGSRLTCCGAFATSLPLDVQLSRILFFGVLFGVADLIVPIAAVLNNPRPFRIATPLVLDPEEYTDVVNKILLAQVKLDGGLYSEPLMYVRLLSVWLHASKGFQRDYCKIHGLSYVRMLTIERDYNYLKQILKSRWGIHVKGLASPGAVLRCPKEINRVRFLLFLISPKMLLCKKPNRYPPCKLQRVSARSTHPVPCVAFTITSLDEIDNATLAGAFPECCDWCVRDDFVVTLLAQASHDRVEWTKGTVKRYLTLPIATTLLHSTDVICDAVYVMRFSNAKDTLSEYLMVSEATGSCLLQSTLQHKLQNKRVYDGVFVFEYTGSRSDVDAVFHNFVEVHVDHSRDTARIKMTCHNVECNAEDLVLAEYEHISQEALDWDTERTDIGQSLHTFYVDGPTRSNVFADLPLTARLTLSYCRGYRPRNRFVVVDPASGEESSIEVDSSCYKTRFGTWRTFHSNRLAYLESHSLANVAYNCSDDTPLLATVSNFVEVDNGGKDAPLQCTGVSILPRGSDWHTIASSLDPSSSSSSSSSEYLAKLLQRAIYGSANELAVSTEAVAYVDDMFAHHKDIPRALPEDMYHRRDESVDNKTLLSLVPSVLLRTPSS